MSEHTRAILLTACPDQPGVIARVTGFLADHAINILDADQHTDPDERAFYMRLEIDPAASDLTRENFDPAFANLANELSMTWRVDWRTRPKRLGVLVTKEGHCLADLIYRCAAGEIDAQIPVVISNHESLKPAAAAAGIPFRSIKITKDNKADAEREIDSILTEHDCDAAVLARYMQIVSPWFVDRWQGRAINIHHSFLPAFAGAKPYHQAHARGVKLIGATAHYITQELDQGPIIEQQTARVGHRDTVDDLIRKGRDLERVVLAEAVRNHVDNRVLISGNKTVVFD
jgi:formyltetrahydrofolate deformylase